VSTCIIRNESKPTYHTQYMFPSTINTDRRRARGSEILGRYIFSLVSIILSTSSQHQSERAEYGNKL